MSGEELTNLVIYHTRKQGATPGEFISPEYKFNGYIHPRKKQNGPCHLVWQGRKFNV
jgi:hypothetical protein